MRNLTIRRIKSVIACVVKAKVYIEDSSAGELFINNIPCRNLGTLKNGEEKTFQIDEEPRKVFVIADKLSKNFCNDFYEIPGGDSDVFLSGKNKFSLLTGNAFRFDNCESKAVTENRKKASKKGLIVLCAAIVIGAVTGSMINFIIHSDRFAAEKNFSSNGLNITLTEKFQSSAMFGYTACYASERVAVVTLKENFSLADGFEELTLDQYRDYVIQNTMERHGLTNYELKNVNGLTGFEYYFTDPQTKNTYCWGTLRKEGTPRRLCILIKYCCVNAV